MQKQFEIRRNTGYTVMSNYHLRDDRLSLQARGLLSQMLSLPDGWDYTVAGLTRINAKNGKDSIRRCLEELEEAGYLTRQQSHDTGGKFATNIYVITEVPQEKLPLSENPTTVEETASPLSGKPSAEKPLTENPPQLNKDISKKEELKKESVPAAPRTHSKDGTSLVKAHMMAILSQLAAKNQCAAADPDLQKSLKNYCAMRDASKKNRITSDATIELIARALAKESHGSTGAMIKMLDRSTLSGWSGLYYRDGDASPAGSSPDPASRVPVIGGSDYV